jgi:integrase/recombinase XerD
VLDQYFLLPATIDRVRASWLGEPIERYVTWLTEQGYARRSVVRRVPLLMRFGEFAQGRGAETWSELPAHVGAFVDSWTRRHGRVRTTERARGTAASEVRCPVQQMLRLVVPGYLGTCGSRVSSEPFSDRVPHFFGYLREERGLRPATLRQYRDHLRSFEAYLKEIDLHAFGQLSPSVLSGFVTVSSCSLSKTSLKGRCSALRSFLRYLYRERLATRDWAPTVEAPRVYRLSEIPRSISWDDVQRMLESVDRSSAVGKRDYAILLLLVAYGLRAREVSKLTLDDIDWKRERVHIPNRKGGHSTAYPLSSVVGEAIVAYLQNGRPRTADRHLFLRAQAPPLPITYETVSHRASLHLRNVGIEVPRPGSHTLRHTCVQRLVDARFSLKTIGDYVGHGSPASTEVYTKVAVEELREIALGMEEELL